MYSKINKFRFVNAASILLFILISLLFVLNLSACTTVVAGKKATKNGAVLFGHNEDDSGRRVVNIWNVPRKQYKHGSVVHLRGGADIPQADVTWALTWFQVPGLPFSDYYANEWGVNVASDACPSREDDPEITDGGIGFMLRRIVAERAKSAREGVEIAGKLLDKLGYVSSGRTLVICDPSEAWILAIVAGKHWVAQRVPDDKAIVLPNVYIIRDVDFNDNQNFIFSKHDIRKYAIKRGWYNPVSDKKFDFAYIFMNKNAQGSRFAERGYDTRQWRGQQLLTGKSVSIAEARVSGLPFFVTPNRKIGVADIQNILRDHYEGTQYGPASEIVMSSSSSDEKERALPSKVLINPNFTTERTICTPSTQFSTVAELREDLPPVLGHMLWFCMGRPDCGVYVPIYLSAVKFSSEFQNMPGITNAERAFEFHFNEPDGTYIYNREKYFWIFNDLENLTDMFYPEAVDSVQVTWSTFEQKIIKIHESVENTVISLMAKDFQKAKLYLEDYSRSLLHETELKAVELTNKIKTDFYR